MSSKLKHKTKNGDDQHLFYSWKSRIRETIPPRSDHFLDLCVWWLLPFLRNIVCMRPTNERRRYKKTPSLLARRFRKMIPAIYMQHQTENIFVFFTNYFGALQRKANYMHRTGSNNNRIQGSKYIYQFNTVRRKWLSIVMSVTAPFQFSSVLYRWLRAKL